MNHDYARMLALNVAIPNLIDFHFYCCVFLVFVLPSGVIKNDDSHSILYYCGRGTVWPIKVRLSCIYVQ